MSQSMYIQIVKINYQPNSKLMANFSTFPKRRMGHSEWLFMPFIIFFHSLRSFSKLNFSEINFSDASYYLSIPYALINCPAHILTIMLVFNIVAIYKDWSLNTKIFETYRTFKTGNPTIDPLNEVPKDRLEKEQCSADSVIHV